MKLQKSTNNEFIKKIFQLKKNEVLSNEFKNAILVLENSVLKGIVFIAGNNYKTWFADQEASKFFFQNHLFQVNRN